MWEPHPPETHAANAPSVASLLGLGAPALDQAPTYFAGLPSYDPEQVRPLLTGLYREDHHGGKPMLEPVVKLQVLMTMEALGHHGINRWVLELQKSPALCRACGIPEGHSPPGVATLYSFIYRLRAADRSQVLGRAQSEATGALEGDPAHEPPARSAPASGTSPPSDAGMRTGLERKRAERQHRRASFLRTLAQESDESREGTGAARAHLDAQLLSLNSSPLPRASPRLNVILSRAGVAPSLRRELITELAFGAIDGTLIASQASGDGRRPPGSPPRPRGEDGVLVPSKSIPLLYAEPTARWGRSASDNSWTFGFRGQLLVARSEHHELPLWLETCPAHIPDVLMGIDLICDFVGYHRNEKEKNNDTGGLRLEKLTADRGYDAIPVYELLHELDIQPRIPLANPTDIATVASSLDLDINGYPNCPGGAKMRLHGWDARYQQTTFNCPCKRPTHTDGRYTFKVHLDDCPLHRLCEPDSVMGPLAHTRATEDFRLTGSPPRDSEAWKLDYNLPLQ
jgi:hypothetical protein